jgi:molybdate transport system regulatory protein
VEEAVAATLRVGSETVDAADAALLRAVAEEGSVSGAAERLGRSLARLERLETAAGSLVERQRGGAGGGGSRLTEDGRALLARFDRLRAALAGTAAATETALDGRVEAVDGELVAVATDAGPVRALVDADPPAPGDRVQVGVRADTVTLHDRECAPAGTATSARNRFEGRVVDRDPGASVVRLAVDVGASDPLRAVVTRDSAGRPGVEPGRTVVVSFNPTATRAVRRSD